MLGSRNDDDDKWSKARKFQDNKIVFTGFGPWSLRKNSDLKPQGSCKGFVMKTNEKCKRKTKQRLSLQKPSHFSKINSPQAQLLQEACKHFKTQ